MIFNSHAEGVDEDAEENSLLENAVVYKKIQASSDFAKKLTDSLHTCGEASKSEQSNIFSFFVNFCLFLLT